jgi:hypothetical protein
MLRFEPTSGYSERPSIDETRTVVYVNVQPRTGGHDAAKTLPLDGVNLDLNTERSVIGIEVLLPDRCSQGHLSGRAVNAQQWRMFVLSDDIDEGHAAFILDATSHRLRIAFFPDEEGEPYSLSNHVTIFATSNRVVALELSDLPYEVFAGRREP